MALEGPKNIDSSKNLQINPPVSADAKTTVEPNNPSIFIKECAWGTVYVKNPKTGEIEMKTTYNGQIVD